MYKKQRQPFQQFATHAMEFTVVTPTGYIRTPKGYDTSYGFIVSASFSEFQSRSVDDDVNNQ
jgi:hypothetical protein